MIIEVESVPDGLYDTTHKRIFYGGQRRETSLRVSTDERTGQVESIFFEFNGVKCSSFAKRTFDELRRFKALLNSFEEL